MRTFLVICCLLVSNLAYANWDSWSPETKTLFVASQLAITADWATTRNAARHNWPNNTYETNPILGRYPHRDRVDIYMITLLVSNYYITDWLPKEYRGFYLGIRTATHAQAAKHNMELGWRMSF